MAPYGSAGTASPSTGSTPKQPQPPTSASGSAAAAAAAQHKRVYQVCIPCRRRKVRCDLGSVDNPHDPPCVRCRRESKECYFSATRRKRKADDDDEASEGDDFVVRNGRRRLNANSTPPREIDRRLYSEVPLTPGGSQGRSQPLRRPDEQTDRRHLSQEAPRNDNSSMGPELGDANQQLENLEAQTVLARGLYGPHDALDLLYKAATDRSVAMQHSNARATKPANEPMFSQPAMPHERHGSRASTTANPYQTSTGDSSIKRERAPHPSYASAPVPPRAEQQPIDPELSKSNLSTQPGYVESLKAWTRFRFVRAGWFTPQEAIEYID